MKFKRTIVGTASALVFVAFMATSPAALAAKKSGDQGFEGQALPIVFVHGFNGSAAQYETQAMRWASNNYPNVVTGIDRVSPLLVPTNDQLDAFFDAIMAESGDSQIYVVAHSAGTSIMVGYLNSSPERTARVAKYINIDGAQGTPPLYNCPGNPSPVPCLNIARSQTSTMGPNNIHPIDYGHTQCVTSNESFVWQYEFLIGKEPATTLVLPEPPGQVEIAGRALNYPDNTGIEGATLQLWEVNSATGVRKFSAPDAEVVLDATGNFGPWPVNGQQSYEINVIRQFGIGGDQRHFYYEPFVRSDYLLRLNNAPPDSTLSETIWQYKGPHTGVSVVRMKEWWGDNPINADNVDKLYITTTTPSGVEEAGNVVTGGTAPHTALTIAMIMFDIGNDGVTHTDSLVNLGPFLSGMDIYMPATADPPNGKITFASQQRPQGTDLPQQVINTPNWSQEYNHFMQVIFRDYVQDINTWGECKRAKPSPCN
jgi:pimeloyl-ACP methyl ester carboxylesterase